MFRGALLFLILMSSVAFAQTDEKPEAKKTDELGIAGYEDISARVDAFIIIELKNNPTARGYVINYGTEKDISRRETQIKKFSAAFNQLDPQRITFVNAGYRETIKTEFWIVPAGAEPPKLIPAAYKIDEFGKLSQKEWKRRVKTIRTKLEKLKSSPIQVRIINYGTEKEIAVAESLIQKYLGENCYDCFGFGGMRITVVRGGFLAKPKRQFWIIPEGGEPPTP